MKQPKHCVSCGSYDDESRVREYEQHGKTYLLCSDCAKAWGATRCT